MKRDRYRVRDISRSCWLYFLWVPAEHVEYYIVSIIDAMPYCQCFNFSALIWYIYVCNGTHTVILSVDPNDLILHISNSRYGIETYWTFKRTLHPKWNPNREYTLCTYTLHMPCHTHKGNWIKILHDEALAMISERAIRLHWFLWCDIRLSITSLIFSFKYIPHSNQLQYFSIEPSKWNNKFAHQLENKNCFCSFSSQRNC